MLLRLGKDYPEGMAADSDYADRFLNAAEDIKESLGRRYGQDFKGLGEACKHALGKNDRIILRHKRPLKVLVDLRNVMQHSHILAGEVLANPRRDAVLALEEIAQKVKNPPQIRTYMIKNPDVVAPADSLAKAAELVIEKGYSQLPVYYQGKYHALFTTNALARWLSEAVRREKGHLIEENITISEVIKFAEHYEQPKFVKPIESADKVCALLSSEELLPAVLVTTDGRSTGELQGIVTRFDVPAILRKITTTFPS